MQQGGNDTIQELFLSFQRGEKKGFAHFFNAHYRAVHFFAAGLLKDEILAEDIVADCFVKLYEKRATIQSAATVKAFLYATVRNACFDALRKEKVRAAHRSDLAHAGEEWEASAHEHLVRTETFSLILNAIEDLPPASRTVFKLYYLEGKSYDEIASHLGRSKETVRKQRQYGLTFLRSKLSGLGILFLLLFLR